MKARRIRTHKLYNTWKGMRQRCNDPNTHNYKWYGGKGIIVCEKWDNFEAFYNWALANGWEQGLELDRKESDLDYNEDNCKWITHIQNIRKSSATKLSWYLVQEIRNIKIIYPELTNVEIGKQYGVLGSAVGKIVSNKAWRI